MVYLFLRTKFLQTQTIMKCFICVSDKQVEGRVVEVGIETRHASFLYQVLMQVLVYYRCLPTGKTPTLPHTCSVIKHDWIVLFKLLTATAWKWDYQTIFKPKLLKVIFTPSYSLSIYINTDDIQKYFQKTGCPF